MAWSHNRNCRCIEKIAKVKPMHCKYDYSTDYHLSEVHLINSSVPTNPQFKENLGIKFFAYGLLWKPKSGISLNLCCVIAYLKP